MWEALSNYRSTPRVPFSKSWFNSFPGRLVPVFAVTNTLLSLAALVIRPPGSTIVNTLLMLLSGLLLSTWLALWFTRPTTQKGTPRRGGNRS